MNWLRGDNGPTESYPTVLSAMTVMPKASSNDQPSTNQNQPVPTKVRITSTATIQVILRIDLGMVALSLIGCHGENLRLVFTLQSTRANQATHASTHYASFGPNCAGVQALGDLPSITIVHPGVAQPELFAICIVSKDL